MLKDKSTLFPTVVLAILSIGIVFSQNHFKDKFFSESAALEAERRAEQESFRRKLQSGIEQDLPWPGLKSAQVSWAWLELLQGLHVESSYDGDFSWMFSKLYFVSKNANSHEIQYLSTLAPFYYVIGEDGAGSALFLYELVKRAPYNYNVNFWSGYHALENLSLSKMAAYFYERAARDPVAPSYLATLSQRLKLGNFDQLSDEQRRVALEKSADPLILEKIKKVRPNWF